jgi:hypothetical protein
LELSALEVEGVKAVFEPEAWAAFAAAMLLAEADCELASDGALRAAFNPDAVWAMDCADAALILWLGSARAWAVFKVELVA